MSNTSPNLDRLSEVYLATFRAALQAHAEDANYEQVHEMLKNQYALLVEMLADHLSCIDSSNAEFCTDFVNGLMNDVLSNVEARKDG